MAKRTVMKMPISSQNGTMHEAAESLDGTIQVAVDQQHLQGIQYSERENVGLGLAAYATTVLLTCILAPESSSPLCQIRLVLRCLRVSRA